MATKTKTHKDTRLDLRIESLQKDFLLYAAHLHKMKLTAFVLSSALKAAEETIKEKIHFFLSEKQWSSFCKILDKPAREIPKLKQLFSKPNVFEE